MTFFFQHLCSVKSQGRILFYLLAGYVILQFVWWAFTLLTLNDEVHEFWKLNVAMGASSGLTEDYFTKRTYMIIGEGAVFLGILISGMIFVLRYMKREAIINKAERNFVLAMSHELKTPIASVRLALQTLLKKDLPDEKRQELLKTALNDNRRLATIAENVLLVARLEQDHAGIVPQEVDFSALVRQICSSLASTVARKHHLTCRVDDEVYVWGDASLLESVVVNLVENAVKYSPEGSEVTVVLSSSQSVVLSVEDQGIGIAPNERDRIFKRFYRSEEENVRKSKGTGLGLYIVYEIVKSHRGKVWSDNNHPQGSIFKVSLPLHQEKHAE